MQAIDAELATTPAAARLQALASARAALAAKLAGASHAIVIPDESIDPLDDPEDLDFKAQSLAQSERRLADEEAHLAARATYYRKQVKLADARSRAAPGRLPRRRAAPQDRAVDRPRADVADRHHRFADRVVEHRRRARDRRLRDPSLVLANVVDPSTLDDLKKAEVSGNPDSRARAANRAHANLEARLARIHKAGLEMEQRAQFLRGQEP